MSNKSREIVFNGRLLSLLHNAGYELRCHGVIMNGDPKDRRCPTDHRFEKGDRAYRQGRNSDLRYYCVQCAKQLNFIVK